MRSILLTLCICTGILFASCDTHEIPLFEDKNELYFNLPFANTPKHDADTVMISFFFYKANVTKLDVNLQVNLSGFPLSSPQAYSIEKIEDQTTLSDENFKLKEQYIFPANQVQDTISFEVFRTEALNSKVYTLTLTFKKNDIFGIGQAEYAKRVILLTSIAIRPAWWDRDFSFALLGDYSEKKLQLFVNLIGDDIDDILHFDKYDSALKRKVSLEFKYWLEAEERAGRTVYEEDGRKMTVSVIG